MMSQENTFAGNGRPVIQEMTTAGAECSFGQGRWDAGEWLFVRSPRWTDMSHWVQTEDHIANFLPDDIRPEDMQMGRDRTGETYISMLWKEPVLGSAKVTTVCAFDGRMAPLIVFSRELSPVHHDHVEVVLYDRGVNIWHHYFQDGKPSWKLLGFIDADLKIGEIHTLSSSLYVTKKGWFITGECDGKSFGCRLDTDWPEQYYVGLTGCEGKNRFYNFKLEPASINDIILERLSD